MSTNNENLLKKLDDFIQFSLDKYFYVDTWKKLYTVSGENHYDIISDKSTIPDLIIYNKSFNKNKCFLHVNKNAKYNKFPRVQFLLRPKKLINYDPSCTYENEKEEANINNDKKVEENIFEPFEFKSIPKEIEDKYLEKEGNSDNMLFDELKEFVKDGKDNSNEIKVKLIHENKSEIIIDENNNKKKNNQEYQDNHDKKEKNNQEKKSNQGQYEKNSKNKHIQINNMNINFNNNISMNNYLMFQQKMLQNIQYQNYLNKIRMNNIYNFNNSLENKFNSFVNKKENINNNINNPKIINNIINDNNYKTSNINNESEKNKDINAISYYKNTDGINEKEEFEKYINNLDEILKNYMNKRNWIVMDNRSNIAVNKFNSEELYYFLNTVISTHENINYSICDLEKDFFFNPIEIHEKLKNMFNKK